MSEILKITDLKIDAIQDDGTSKPIVNQVSLSLNRGQVLGLIGESGAGKSTIGLAALGYCRPGCRITGGSIVFDGLELTTASQKQKQRIRSKRIAYVAQSAAAAFNPAYKLIRQYTESPVWHKVMSQSEAEADAKKIYRRLLLPDPEHIGYRYPHQVSGGQLQRAMVAMAMSCRPDIIVFDEPTTALDVTTQIEVLAAIKKVTREFDTSAIYITHDLAVVLQLADRIKVLRYGMEVEEGTPTELLENPKQQYTRDLLTVRTFKKEQARRPEGENFILEIQGLTASYTKASEPVLRHINLKVPFGKTVAIVGESGSGKTSLARSIIGLLPPTQGRVLYKGRELPVKLAKRSRDDLRQLQMIYQLPDVALNPKQKVQNILGRPLQFYFGMDREARMKRIHELLELVELPVHFVRRFPTELSGGEKQRICIARALAAEPEVIICDEVTSALDQLVAEEVLKLLQSLQKDLGVTYLFITHDLATVRAIADEVVVMLLGEIVEQGPKSKVMNPPHHEYTELLLSSVPEMRLYWLDELLRNRNHRTFDPVPA